MDDIMSNSQFILIIVEQLFLLVIKNTEEPIFWIQTLPPTLIIFMVMVLRNFVLGCLNHFISNSQFARTLLKPMGINTPLQRSKFVIFI